MEINEGVLYLSDPIKDEGVEELIAVLSQDDLEKIKIDSDSIDPASMQVLLCSSKTKEVEIADKYYSRLFDNLIKA